MTSTFVPRISKELRTEFTKSEIVTINCSSFLVINILLSSIIFFLLNFFPNCMFDIIAILLILRWNRSNQIYPHPYNFGKTDLKSRTSKRAQENMSKGTNCIVLSILGNEKKNVPRFHNCWEFQNLLLEMGKVFFQ